MLKQFDIDRLRHRVNQGAAFSHLRFQGIELGAGLELACAWRVWEADELKPEVLREVASWARQFAVVVAARRAFNGLRSQVELFGAPTLEIQPLGTRSALSQEGMYFFDRFRRSLIRNGQFSSRTARAVAVGMLEMADNAIQHSGPDEHCPAPGAMGYEVEGGHAAFGIVDLGRGVLMSLRSNPVWARLASSRDALDAAVRRGASRRVRQGQGKGFSELHRAMADLSGVLRFASGDAALTLNGRGEAREAVWLTRPPMGGFQISVVIGKGK